MGSEGYSIVFACHPEQGRLIAEGPVKPSSEALTHGLLYALRPSIGYVVHVHSSEIWRAAGKLGLPGTDPSAAYGTPAMTEEVRRLLKGPLSGDTGVFVMLGHDDGVVSFGPDGEDNSTGLYRGGATPDKPFRKLANVNLKSEHVLKARLEYEGRTLKLTLTDTETGASHSESFDIDIPAAVQGTKAYVGFGAGSGGKNALFEILTWVYQQG